MQTRTQTNCAGDCGPTCGAPSTQTQPCFIGVPYYLSVWSDWGNCSQYCGAGVQTRNQTCLGTCANSSASCQGGAVSLQTASCTGGGIKLNPVCCISYFILQQVYQSYGQAGVHLATAAQSINAILIEYKVIAHPFSCGPGNSTRSRVCNGNCYDCLGNATETQPCQIGWTSTIVILCSHFYTAIAREWAAWGEWSTCNSRFDIGIFTTDSLTIHLQLWHWHRSPQSHLCRGMWCMLWLSKRLPGLRDQ